MSKRRILGIDPGTNVMGYSILDVEGSHAEVVVLGTVQLKNIGDHYARLKRIFDRTRVIIEEFEPQELAIEAPFFGVNSQSTIKLGRAQGVCMAAALTHGMPVSEYAPLRVKQSITGHGDATKEQVAMMLQKLLHFAEIPKYLDATDALGIAYCHFLASRMSGMMQEGEKGGGVKLPKATGKSSNWSDFVKNNPNRISKK